MEIHKLKCSKCGKLIEGVSEKEVKAWMEQHDYAIHQKKGDDGK